MKKHFLLLFLMALLPLAGWAQNYYDVSVTPYDAASVWCGEAPTVQRGWISLSGSGAVSNPSVKDAIAACLVAQTTDGYDVGEHTYKLVQSSASNEVQVGEDLYTFHVLSSSTATLTITKFTGDPVIETNQLTYVENSDYTGSAKPLLTLTDADGAKAATATVNGVAAPVVYALSADASDWTEDYASLTGTDAGTYTVYYKVAGTTNYTGSATATAFGGVGDGMKILQKNLADAFTVADAKPTANTWTYDTEAHVLFSAPVAPISFGTTEIPYEYSLTGEDETWYTSAQIAASEDLTAAFKGTSNTGNKTVYWRVKETANYTGHVATALTATIEKATPVFTELPTFADSKGYDGEEIHLITSAGEATLGAVPVFERKTGTGAWTSTWKDNINDADFIRSAAYSYQIRYTTKTTADLNPAIASPYGLSDPIVISKADIAGFTEPVAKTGLRVNGADQELVEAASWGENTPAGTFSYSLDGINYDAAVPTATDEDDYIVYFKMTPTDATNYNVFENQYAVSIAAANPAYIIPVAANKYYGQTDPALTYTVQDGTGAPLENSVLKGTVELARTNGNNVGEYIIYVKAYTPGADEAYDVANVLNTPTSVDEANKTAVFKINVDPNAKLKLNFTADAIENKSSKVYDGTTDIAALAFDKNDLEADESTLLDGDTWETLKAAATVNFTLANKNVALGNQVTVTVTGLANYAAVEVTPLPFAVTPLPITITANDQVIAQGADIDQDEYVTAPAPVAGDDLNIVLTATKSAVGEWDNAIEVSAENANYDFTFVAGKLTINGAGAIALGEGGNDLQLISDYAGQNVNVTINFAGTRNGRDLGGERNWVKENWVTLTLPFDIDVATLSQKLGYAIVNVIDDTKTKVDGTSSEFYGKLTMKGGNGYHAGEADADTKLAANKPIVVKIADDIANVGTAGKVDFGSQLIVAPTDLTVDAGQGAKFVGTYAQKEVSSANDENIWFLIGGGYTKWAYIMSTSGATWTIAPFEAYIDMSNPGVQAMTFYFEDIDGTVTAISSVDADNSDAKQAAEGWYTLQGVKLESAPTQKGIYIFNGKKVAIQ